MIEDHDEYYKPSFGRDRYGDMKDVDSESGSQSGRRRVDVHDPAHEKEGTVVTMKRPLKDPREAHSSGFSYHKQTAF